MYPTIGHDVIVKSKCAKISNQSISSKIKAFSYSNLVVISDFINKFIKGKICKLWVSIVEVPKRRGCMCKKSIDL